jgi:hypothetical protein
MMRAVKRSPATKKANKAAANLGGKRLQTRDWIEMASCVSEKFHGRIDELGLL